MSHWELHRTDAFVWLAERGEHTIHAVVTDPPYGVAEYSPNELLKQRNGNGGIWRLPQSYDGHKRSPVPRFTVLGQAGHERIREFHGRLAPLLLRVLVPGGHVLMASHTLLTQLVVSEFVTAGFEMRAQIVRVVKTLRGGDRPKGAHTTYPDVSVSPRSCWEPWLIFRKPCEGTIRDNLAKWATGGLRRNAQGTPFSDLIQSRPARGEERRIAPHPSLKPQAFMRQLVRAALPLGKGVILDPFAGSGSTVAAAAYLGLEAIGLEIDEDYFGLAQDAVPRLAALRVNGGPQAASEDGEAHTDCTQTGSSDRE